MEIKTITQILEERIEEAKLPDEGETFKLTKDIHGVDEVDSKFKTLNKNQTLKTGIELEVQSTSNVVIYVKAGEKYYGFYTPEWKTLPLKLV